MHTTSKIGSSVDLFVWPPSGFMPCFGLCPIWKSGTPDFWLAKKNGDTCTVMLCGTDIVRCELLQSWVHFFRSYLKCSFSAHSSTLSILCTSTNCLSFPQECSLATPIPCFDTKDLQDTWNQFLEPISVEFLPPKKPDRKIIDLLIRWETRKPKNATSNQQQQSNNATTATTWSLAHNQPMPASTTEQWQ